MKNCEVINEVCSNCAYYKFEIDKLRDYSNCQRIDVHDRVRVEMVLSKYYDMELMVLFDNDFGCRFWQPREKWLMKKEIEIRIIKFTLSPYLTEYDWEDATLDFEISTADRRELRRLFQERNLTSDDIRSTLTIEVDDENL